MSFVAELKRRNVFRMAGLYLVGAWLIVQVTGTILPMFGAPAWLPRSVVVLLAVGMVPVLVFSWVYELTPEGLKRERDIERHESITPDTGRRIDRAMLALLVLAVGIFALDRFVLAPRRIAEVAAAAKARPATEVAVPDNSIAVLPLANASGDKDQQYFSDGLSEGLIIALSRLEGLKVIGRNSSFQFRDSNHDSQAIGSKLGVANVLEGSVQRVGDMVRISASLIRAADRSTLWADQYDRPYKDLFALQDEIVRAVADALRARLLGATPAAEQSDRPPGGNLAAYEAVLQGNFVLERRNKADSEQAIALFERATMAEPGYAYAWARLTVAYLQLLTFTQAAEATAIVPKAQAAAATALRLNPDLAEAHASRGRLLQVIDLDLKGSEAALRRAVELAPQNAQAQRWLGVALAQQARTEDALAALERAERIDPLSAAIRFNTGLYQLHLGRWEEAEASLREAIELQPKAAQYRTYLALAQSGRGQTAEAVATARLEPDEFWRTWGLALVCFANGEKAESDAALASLISDYAADSAVQIAAVYAQRGEADEMFRWLDRALATRDPGLVEIYATPFFDRYYGDPRMAALAPTVGLPPPPVAPAQKAPLGKDG